MGNTQPQRSNVDIANSANELGPARIPLNIFDPPQNPNHELKPLECVPNNCTILKDTLQLKHVEGRSQNTYCLTFSYSSSHNVFITVYFQATVEKELLTGKIKSFSMDMGAPNPKQYKCPSGLNQNFPDNIIKIDTDLFGGIEKLTTHTESKYPLIITIEPTGEDVQTHVRNVYMFDFVANDKGELTKVHIVKQKLEVGDETYEIDDIFISSADNPDNQTLNYGNVTCIVCYSANAKVLLYPCRHFCLCETCSKKVQQELKACPVCRKHVERFFPIQLEQRNELPAST